MGVFPFPMPFSGPPKFGSFSPLALFAASEPGGWYDPSDLTTLFQDAAGTTPVTAVEQPVGLVLDKSKGLVLGPELVTNGDFSVDANWTKGAGWTISGGVATTASSNSGTLDQAISLTAGRAYRVDYTITGWVSGQVQIGFSGGTTVLGPLSGTGNGTRSIVIFAVTGNNTLRVFKNSSLDAFSIDNISVRELPGNHLSQSTSTARPVLSARVNLLTYTEQFDNAAWTKTLTSVTANAATAPNGTATADKIIVNNGSAISSAYIYQDASKAATATPYKFSIRAKAAEYNQVTVLVQDAASSANRVAVTWSLTNGSVAVAAIAAGTFTNVSAGAGTSLGDGWYAFEISFTSGTETSLRSRVYAADSSATTGNGASGIYIWGADLRPSNAGVGLPTYQRVGAATSGTSSAAGNADYDTTGFPLYLKFDGTDDFLVSGTINPGSVDKAQVFAGVRKLSDTRDVQFIAEYSTSIDANNGAFALIAPRFQNVANSSQFSSRGTAIATAVNDTFTTPSTRVISGIADISGDYAAIRQNGALVTANTATDQGSGNFGNYPLYVGKRDNTAYIFAGNIYSLILRFSATNMDAATIASTETWVNQRTKAY